MQGQVGNRCNRRCSFHENPFGAVLHVCIYCLATLVQPQIEVKRREVEKECDIDEVMFCQKLEEKRKEGIKGRWEMGIGMGSDLGILFSREYI